MGLLEQAEIDSKLAELTGWDQDDDTIRRTYSFDDFVSAVDFVNDLVGPAEQANHHPDLTVSWGQVGVSLMTHDEGGLTEKDFELAETIDQIYHEEYSDE